MVNRARAKGTSHETALVNYLIERGFKYAHRNPLSSPEGDIGGTPLVIEAKNHVAMDLGTWVAQAEKSSLKTGKPYCVAHKRRGKGIAKTYATTDFETMVTLMKAFEICTERGIKL